MKQIICFFYFLIHLTGFSQNIQIKKLDVKNGLPDNSVRDIIQDHHGYIWFGTLNGLSRFDGKNFKNYAPISGDTTSLTNSRVIKIKEDQKGFIWSWSDDYSLQRVNPITNEVINLHNHILPKESQIKDFIITTNGDVWVWGDNSYARIKYIDAKGNLKADIFNKKNQLIKNTINFLFEDPFKNIWIGTNAGLININFSNGKRTTNTYFKNSSFISFNLFQNNIWFGTQSDGVFKYSSKTHKIVVINKGINNKPILCIKQLNPKTLLLGSNELLIEYNLNQNKLTPIYNPKFNTISKFFKDSFNNIWIITNNRGVFKYSEGSKKIEYYELKTNLASNFKIEIIEDSHKNIWAGTGGEGLFLYKRNENTFFNYRYDEEKAESISSDIVLSIFEDNSKNLWIGTMYGGVNKINVQKENFFWYKPIKNPSNMFENEIRSSVQDRKGNIWLGSKGGKLFCYQNNKLKYTFPDDLSAANKSKIKDISIYSLFIDHTDNLWIGTKGNKGLFIIKNISNASPANVEIIQYDVLKSNVLNNVFSIIQDKNKNYWIGSHAFGLSVLSNPFDNPKIITYKQSSTQNHLLSNFVRNLYFDSDGNLWIGTNKGLNLLPENQLKNANRKFISFDNRNENNSSLSFNDVDHIFQASDKSIYVATLGGGINVLNYNDFKKKHFVWRHLNVSNGLSNNKIYAIQEDSEKNIWISTNLGINKYYPKTGKFEIFLVEKEYGLNYFSEGNGIKLSNGDLLFGHNRGILRFNPKSIIKDTSKFPLVLSKFFVNGNEQLPRISTSISKNIEYEKEATLSYEQNTIRFDFSVLDFKNPEKIQFSYKLDNFDQNWSVPLTNNSAIYQNLPPGEYTFMLKATNSDGVELPEVLQFEVNIKPPFFKSILGYFITFLFFGSLFIGFLYLYKKQIATKQEVLFGNRLNEKKLMYYTNISHEFKTPLTLILCHIQDIIDDVKVASETKLSANQIQKSASYLTNLIEQILDFRKIREEKMKLSLVEMNIVEYIKNIQSQFIPLANKEEINLTFSSDEKEILGYLDDGIIKKVLYNLLSNAIKFTPAGKAIHISLKLKEKANHIKIMIADEGIGISNEDQKTLFERFGKSENSSGLGLFFVKELINCHNGSIKVSSILNQGTTFTISLPISKKEYSQADINATKIVVDENNFSEPLPEILLNNEIKIGQKKQTESILIIDDNDEMRAYLSNKFSAFFNVFTATNGKEGVEIATKEIPDIIVCDLMMPVMDGMGAVQLLKENFNTCHIPIILLTANSAENKKLEGIRIGADDYITKPFNFSYLKLKIDALITQRNKIIQTLSKNPELSLGILTNSDEDKQFVEKVMQLVENNIGEAYFNVDFIASEMGLSRTNFYKKMKEVTNETPREFINTIQMKKAALLLKNTNYTISEISVICGFNDTNYFSKIFKKYFGESPKSYQIDNKE